LPLIPFMGIKSWTWLVALYGALAAVAAIMWRSSRTGLYNIRLGLAINLVVAVLFSRVCGIFLVTPIFLSGIMLTHTTTQWLIERRWMIVGWTVAAFLVPAALEYAGLFMGSWEVTDTAIIGHSEIFGMSGVFADTTFFLVNIALVSMVGLISARIHSAAKQAKRALAIQAWHLNHLLPESTSSSAG
jgi:hypothetical protein